MRSAFWRRIKELRFRLALGLKFGAVGLCVAFALRGKPPASAQTSEDQRQDDAIATLRENTDKTESRLDQRLDMMEIEIRTLHDGQEEGRSENRFEFGGIGLLYGGGALLGRRKKGEPA